MRNWVSLMWLTGESIFLLALWLCSPLGATSCGVTQVTKWPEKITWALTGLIIESSLCYSGKCRQGNKRRWTLLLLQLLLVSSTHLLKQQQQWWNTDLKVHRVLITFVQMYWAMFTSFSKQIFNNIFIIREQGNRVQYPCAFEVASSATIITYVKAYFIFCLMRLFQRCLLYSRYCYWHHW